MEMEQEREISNDDASGRKEASAGNSDHGKNKVKKRNEGYRKEVEEMMNREVKNGKNNQVTMRYGREGIGINEEWVYTIKLEKSYGGIINGN